MLTVAHVSLVRVSMVHIGIVRVRVDQRHMYMRVGMRLPTVPRLVRMLMVRVVRVRMAVFLLLVRMAVPVVFRYMQPDPRRHQSPGNGKLPRRASPCSINASTAPKKGATEK